MSVSVWLLSADTRSERRFNLDVTVLNLKGKIELITGIPVSSQLITVLDSEDSAQPSAALDDDSKQLGFYGVRDWQFLKVHDTNPSISFTGQLTDISQVEKFELSEAAYAERNDTVLAYKQRHKVGRFATKEEEVPLPDPSSYNIPLGSRCEIQSSEEGLHKRGTVRFFGSTKFGKGDATVWVGVEFDEPFGKNDGSVQGERYFTCLPNYGSFVRPDRVDVGDYPAIELDLEDEEM